MAHLSKKEKPENESCERRIVKEGSVRNQKSRKREMEGVKNSAPAGQSRVKQKEGDTVIQDQRLDA